nr:PREDICTED: killer cell immunoglobulin-like receptor 2DL4 [Equus przewalskii]
MENQELTQILQPIQDAEIKGGQDKPSLSAWPSPVVPLGGNVTLQCHFHLPFVVFKILRWTHIPELQRGIFNSFTVSPVTTAREGIYEFSRTYNHIPSVWSGHSDPLEIMVTGRKSPALAVFTLCPDGPTQSPDPSGTQTVSSGSKGHRA